MKQRNNIIAVLVVLLFGIMLVSSCSRRPKGVLNPKQMENLLVDLHVLEGSLSAARLSYNSDEKNSYYLSLFDKYNITKSDFDSCLSWYTKHPKQFERIYVKVTNRVESLRTDIYNGKYYPVDSTARSGEENLWYKPEKYAFTKDSARNKLSFEIKNNNLLANDVYELSFIQRIAPSDSSVNPHAVMYVNYLNGTIDSIYTKIFNDSVKRKFTMIFKARKDLKIKSLSGYLMGNDSAKGKMNATIDSVKLYRRFKPFKQDSIRQSILKIDTTKVPLDTLKKDSVITPARKERLNKKILHPIQREKI